MADFETAAEVLLGAEVVLFSDGVLGKQKREPGSGGRDAAETERSGASDLAAIVGAETTRDEVNQAFAEAAAPLRSVVSSTSTPARHWCQPDS